MTVSRVRFTEPWGGNCCCGFPYYSGVDVPCCAGVILPNIMHLTWSGTDSTPASGIPHVIPLIWQSPLSGVGGWVQQYTGNAPPGHCNTTFGLNCDDDGWHVGITQVPFDGIDLAFGLPSNPPSPGIICSCSPFLLDIDLTGQLDALGCPLGLWSCGGAPDCSYSNFGTITHVTVTT